jgi:hypothetical protein
MKVAGVYLRVRAARHDFRRKAGVLSRPRNRGAGKGAFADRSSIPDSPGPFPSLAIWRSR